MYAYIKNILYLYYGCQSAEEFSDLEKAAWYIVIHMDQKPVGSGTGWTLSACDAACNKVGYSFG
jgi:hypothetical protein